MKQFFLLIATLLFITNQTLGQLSDSASPPIKERFKFLYILKFENNITVVTENAFVAPSQRDSTYALKYKQNDMLLQYAGVDGVIVIKIKKNSKLLSLNDVFDLYNVKPQLRKKKITIDDQVIQFPETLFISKSEIENLKLIKSGNDYQIRIFLRGYFDRKKDEKEDDDRKQ